MLSMVGRRAAPNGVERKSDGRSLIHDGIEEPVRKPTQSFVNELQLKSVFRSVMILARLQSPSYLGGDTNG